MHSRSPEVEHISDSSAGSANLLEVRGAADGFETPGSSLYSRFAAAGLFRLARIRETVGIGPESSRLLHSSMESDSSCSNFVFMQGAFCNWSSGKVMDYNGENSEEAHTNVGTSCRKDNAGEAAEDLSQGDSAAESINKNDYSSSELDPLAESINSFLTLQEALEKEIQKFQEIRKEATALHHGADNIVSIHATGERISEATSSHRFGTRMVVQRDSNSSDTSILVKRIEYLEVKLEETRSMLEVKESQIRELESAINLNISSGEEVASTSESQQEGYRGKEIRVEDAFQQKVEAEIEYMILTRSVENLKAAAYNEMNLCEGPKALAGEEAREVLSKLGEAGTKATILKNRALELEKHCGEIVEETGEMQSIKKKACKTTSCLFLQLGLLLVVACLFIFQMLSESETVVPT